MTAILSTVTVATHADLMTPDAYAGNLKSVVTIGNRTTRLASDVSKVAAAVIEQMGESYDWTARGAKPAAVHTFVCGEAKGANVPAQKDADKRPTAYGVGVDSLVHAITRILDVPADEKPAAMRVSLTGVGSAVVPADHPAYALLLALLGAEEDTDADQTV